MIDVTREKLIRFSDVPTAVKWLPDTDGKPVHFSTIQRWARKGRRARSGAIIRLSSVGGCTTEGALLRFFEQLEADNPAVRTPSQAVRSRELAAKILDAARI